MDCDSVDSFKRHLNFDADVDADSDVDVGFDVDDVDVNNAYMSIHLDDEQLRASKDVAVFTKGT